MSSPLDILPDLILDRLVSVILDHIPSARVCFLASLGTRIHISSVRVLFKILRVPDDARYFEPMKPEDVGRSLLFAILSNPTRYAHAVKSLFVDWQQLSIESWTNCFPMKSQQLNAILETCSGLEDIVWNSALPPPDGICEYISIYNCRLTRFTYIENTQSRSSEALWQTHQSKWDIPSLPLLSALPLTTLHLSHLSQSGTRALSSLLLKIGEYSLLEDVRLAILWLDDRLCETIVAAGRKIRALQLSTKGTKLSDRGIQAIIEGCVNLENLVLEDVQGRLSRTLWSKPQQYPAPLKRIRVAISESSPLHSWTADHLLSLYAIPFSSLEEFSLARKEALPNLIDGALSFNTVIDDVASLKPVPSDFVDGVRKAKSMAVFECDWWAWDTRDIKALVESCMELERIKICLDIPLSKFLSLASNFANLPKLRELSVCINPVHAPGSAPIPLLPVLKSSLSAPTESHVVKTKAVLPQLLDLDQVHAPNYATSSMAEDPSMPLLREIKRFARKCPNLKSLIWYGRHGRGTWNICRPSATTSKLSGNVSIDYSPPTISKKYLAAIMSRPTEPQAKGSDFHVTERIGQNWSGPMADEAATEREAEIEKEKAAFARDKDKSGRLREGRQKAHALLVTTTNSEEVFQPLSPPGSTHSRSPTLRFSPSGPRNSNQSGSQATALSSISETVESHAANGIDRNNTQKSQSSRSKSWRIRNTSISASTEDKGNSKGYFDKSLGSKLSCRSTKVCPSKNGGSAPVKGGSKKRTESGGESSRRGRGRTRGGGTRPTGSNILSDSMQPSRTRKPSSRRSPE